MISSSNAPRKTKQPARADIAVSVLVLTSPVLLLIAFFLFNRSESFECVPLDAEATNTGWLVGLAVTILASALATWLLRGTSSPVRRGLLCGACLLLWIPMSARLILVSLNGMLDGSAPTAHHARVLENEYRTGKTTGRNHVRVESWRRNERYLDLDLPAVSSYQFSFVNDVSIVTRPGALGWECIDTVKPLLLPGQRTQMTLPSNGSVK